MSTIVNIRKTNKGISSQSLTADGQLALIKYGNGTTLLQMIESFYIITITIHHIPGEDLPLAQIKFSFVLILKLPFVKCCL